MLITQRLMVFVRKMFLVHQVNNWHDTKFILFFTRRAYGLFSELYLIDYFINIFELIDTVVIDWVT